MTMLIPIRDENPYHRVPVVTVALVALNVYLFFKLPPVQQNVERLAAVPCDVLGRCDDFSQRLADRHPGRSPSASVLTSMFMHGNFAHLAGNMLYLWVFGNNVEDRFGHLRYAAFYLGCGLAATASHFALDVGSQVPIIGASGAVSGVLGAYLVMFPRARVLSLVPFLFFLPVEVSAGLLLGMWFVLQLLAGLQTGGRGGVAFFAHVGGFAAGWVVTRAFAPRARRDQFRAIVRRYDDD